MSLTSIRILLIDDEESDYLMTRTLLGRIEGTQMEVEWASSFEEGLARLTDVRHDVCLLDYFLEDRNGTDLLRLARSRGVRTPVILLTGKGSRDVDLEAMRAGAVDYLQKGGDDPWALERAIRYAVERHRAQEELRRSEERHRGMFDHLPLGLYRVTAEGDYMEANPSLIRMLEYPDRRTLREVHARNFFVSSLDRIRFQQILDDHGVVLGFESELRTSGGRPIRVRNTARVHRGPAGRVEYVEGSVEEVEGGPSERAPDADAAAFRTLLDHAPTSVLLVEPGGQVRAVSAHFAALVGSDAESLRSRALWELFEVADQAEVARTVEEFTGWEVAHRTLRAGLPSRSGEHLQVVLDLHPVTRRGGALEAVLVFLSHPSPPT